MPDDAERRIAVVSAVLGLETLVSVIPGGRYDYDPAVDHPFAFVADRRASAGEVSHIMRNR